MERASADWRTKLVDASGALARLVRRLVTTRRGSPALEFALMAPLLITLALGVNDVSNALITQRQVTTAAQEVAEIATGISANISTQQSILTPEQAQAAASVIYALMPGLSSGQRSSDFSVTLTSVQFTQADPNCVPTANAPCAYAGKVIWSLPLSEGPADTSVTRPLCAKLNQVDAATLQQLTMQQYLAALPTANVTAPSSLLISDVFYKFTPFLSFVVPTVEFRRTAFLPPRVGNAVSDFVFYSPPSPLTDPHICPGAQQLPTNS